MALFSYAVPGGDNEVLIDNPTDLRLILDQSVVGGSSVDVSDGVTSYNLYYADTFSAFPNVSARYGLPMTDIAHTEADMTPLFPTADTNTVLTLYIQVGLPIRPTCGTI